MNNDETKIGNETKELTIVEFATIARAEVLRSFCVDAADLDEWYFHRQALRIDIGRPNDWLNVLDVAYNLAERYAFKHASFVGPMNFMFNFKMACERLEKMATTPRGMKIIIDKTTQYPADVGKVIEEECQRRESIDADK